MGITRDPRELESLTGLKHVGWMPDKALAEELGLNPLHPEWLTTIEQAEYDGGIRPEFLARMIPVLAADE